MEIGPVLIPEPSQAQRLAGFCVEGLIGFPAELVRGRACFFGSGVKNWLISMSSVGQGQSVFPWLWFQGPGVFL